MTKLIWTCGNNQADFQRASDGCEVVIKADARYAILLAHCKHRFRVTAYPSVESFAGRILPDADFYWAGRGYVRQFSLELGEFRSVPLG
jgi:hypothetical protein